MSGEACNPASSQPEVVAPLTEIDFRKSEYNAVGLYLDGEGKVLVKVDPRKPGEFEPFAFEARPEEAREAFIHPHPYAEHAGRVSIAGFQEAA